MELFLSDQEYIIIISRIRELEAAKSSEPSKGELIKIRERLEQIYATPVDDLKDIYKACYYLTGGDIPDIQFDIYEQVKSRYTSEESFRRDFFSYLDESVRFPSLMWALTPYTVRFSREDTFIEFKKLVIDSAEKYFSILDNHQTDKCLQEYFEQPINHLENLSQEQNRFKDFFFDKLIYFYFCELDQHVNNTIEIGELDDLFSHALDSSGKILYSDRARILLTPTEAHRRLYQQHCTALIHAIQHRQLKAKEKRKTTRVSRSNVYNPDTFRGLFIPIYRDYISEFLNVLKKHIPIDNDTWEIKHKGYIKTFYEELIEIGVIYHYKKEKSYQLQYVTKKRASQLFDNEFGVGGDILYANDSFKRITAEIERLKQDLKLKKESIYNKV